MQLKTFNEILTEMCDDFDSLISPRTISRSNTNVIYLLLKSIAKGYEVINNTCVALSSKFDPASCSESELLSVASIVGTEKLAGSRTGLKIDVTNNDSVSHVLYAGTYTYALDSDTNFSFTVDSDVTVDASDSVSYVAESDSVGQYEVTAQESITVTYDGDYDVDSHFNFMCYDNTESNLIGTSEETNLEFRKRIISDTERQDVIEEIETKIKNLPYVFDCNVIFNAGSTPYAYNQQEEYTIDPYTMLIFVSACNIKNEIAEVVAKYGIYPTQNVTEAGDGYNSVVLTYKNDVFATGAYTVYVTPYRKYTYKVKVQYYAESDYASDGSIKMSIRDALRLQLNSNKHKDYITASDVYDVLTDLALDGVKILSASLYAAGDSSPSTYLQVPKTSIPYLDVSEDDITNV